MAIKNRTGNILVKPSRENIPDIKTIAQAKEEILRAHMDFQNLLFHVREQLEERFFGTYATVEVTECEKHHVQLVMFLYREAGWHVSSLVDEGKEYLRFRDPRSISA